MSAPRWTRQGRVIAKDGIPVLLLKPAIETTMPVVEQHQLIARIVSLLNATELTSDAAAALQVAVTEHTAARRQHHSVSLTPEYNEMVRAEIQQLDALTDTLNHTVRMYVELDEEPSIALDEH